MAGNYWIKLYLEILDDSKMAVLPDRLWRRVIELFLLAGRYHQDGGLPDTAELAWSLRMPMDDLDLDLKQIASTGIIERTAGGWIIPKFKVRQEPPPAERMRQSRDRKRKEQYYATEPVTNCNNLVTQINRLTDTDTESDKRLKEEEEGKVFKFYSQNFGNLTPGIADTLNDFLNDYPVEWILEAMKRAIQREARNLAYVRTILEDWRLNGFQAKRTNNGRGKSQQNLTLAEQGYTDVTAERLARESTP